MFCHAAVAVPQESREINSCLYAHFNYHVMIAQRVKFSLHERCLFRSVVLEKNGLGGPGLYTARAVLDIATNL